MAPRARTYLDFNASAPLLGEAREAMRAASDLDGNPSSVHAEGRRLRAIIEAARDDVAGLVGAEPSEVVFTSGASEANCAMLGARWTSTVAAGVEHDSVLAPLAAIGADGVRLPVGADGVIADEALNAALAGRETSGRAILAVQLANNETGVIQPVARLAAIARPLGFAVHCDAVQAPGRIPLDFHALGVDTMALSAHKMGGPKGVGALVIRDGFDLPAFITGGGQERRRRAGTENVAGIAGFGAAARVARERLHEIDRVRALHDRLEAALLDVTPDAVIIGRDADRLANTTCIARAGLAAEITVIKLDVAGFAVSAGSACSSGKVAPSRVLAAMGLSDALTRAGVRISIGFETTPAEIDAFVRAWRDVNVAQAQVLARDLVRDLAQDLAQDLARDLKKGGQPLTAQPALRRVS